MELVRDENDRAAVVRHRADRREECICFLRREHRSRLVEYEDAGILVERLEDLDPLLFAERELPDPRARLHGEAVPSREVGHAPLDRPRA